MLTGNFLINGMKTLTFIIDKGIYSLVQVAYSVFYYVANATILNDQIVTNFTMRMYTLLGIVMIFVLAFNLLSYIVDPDKITDKKVGASTFVKDIVLALVLISLAPMLFTKLYSLQSKIITSGIIPNLILGGNAAEEGPSYDDYVANQSQYSSLTDYYVQNGANSMVASVYVAFLYPENGFTALDCNTSRDDGTYTDYCEAYKKVKDGYNLNAFSDFITNDDYNFTPFLTTVAGIVLLFFMLSFCINLAKRVGKLAIIQLIAPIPCTLELIPSKKGLRDNWIKTLVKVYLEVFFYLLVMYIIIFLISLIPGTISTLFGSVFSDGIGPVKLLTVALLIFGLLMFGKEAPQMIFDLLGIKSTGIIKEAALRGVKMAGSVTSGLGASATTLTRNGVGMIRNVAGAAGAGGKAKALASGLIGMGTGTVTAAARGMYVNRNGGFKGIVGRTSTAINQNAEAQRRTAANMRDYAQGIQNASGLKGKVGAMLNPARENIIEPIGKWAGGNNFGAMNAELQSYNQFKGVFDSTKIKPATDERYLSFQKELDKTFADNGIDPNDFNAKKKAYLAAHAGSTLNDYLSSADYATDFGAAGAYAAADISRLSGAMDSREAAMKTSKKDDLMIAVAQAKALVDSNSDIAAIAKDAGIDVKSINISASSSDADIIAAYDTLKKLNTKVGDKMTQIKTEIAAQEMRDKQKKSGGGSGNSGSSK